MASLEYIRNQYLDPDYGAIESPLPECDKCGKSFNNLYSIHNSRFDEDQLVCSGCVSETLEENFRDIDYDKAKKCKNCYRTYEETDLLECLDNQYFDGLKVGDIVCYDCRDAHIKRATNLIIQGLY